MSLILPVILTGWTGPQPADVSSVAPENMTQTDHLRSRVLVVEDDPDMAAIICDFLAANGGVRADHGLTTS
jgi:hypothetical protein